MKDVVAEDGRAEFWPRKGTKRRLPYNPALVFFGGTTKSTEVTKKVDGDDEFGSNIPVTERGLCASGAL